MFQSIRSKFTIWYTLVMTVIVIVFALFSYLLLYQQISSDIQENINNNLATISNDYLVFDENGSLSLKQFQEDQPTLSEFLQANNQSLRIIDANKNIITQLGVFKSEIKPSLSKINSVFLTGQTQTNIYRDNDGNQVFYIISPILNDQKIGGVIEISQPINDSMKTLSNLILILVIGVFVSITISLIAGYSLSKQTLGYVDELIDNVETITQANDLDKRLPVPKNYSDELTRLASTFNSLLTKVESELVREKNFTANASHDLRTPITIIQGNIDLALRKKNLTPSQVTKLLFNLKNETKRMSAMIDDLLELSTIEKNFHNVKQKIDLDSILSEVIDSYQAQIKFHHIDLDYKFKSDHEKITIYGNPNLIKRLFSNIIDNAIKYNQTHGQIIIKTYTKSNRYNIIIQDTGIGIPAKDLPYIFDRLYQSQKSRTGIMRGYGLGLAIAKEIVGLHQGQILVSSREGAGTKFTIIFPQK